MSWMIAWISLQVAAFLILLLLGILYFDRRYKKRKPRRNGTLDASPERTSEVFIDPKNGIKYRVYYHRDTGEREYIEEE